MKIWTKQYNIIHSESPEGYEMYWIRVSTYLFGYRMFRYLIGDFEVERDNEIVEVPFFLFTCAEERVKELMKKK